MKPKDKVAELIRKKLRFTAGSTLRDRFLADVLHAHEESRPTAPARYGTGIGRIVMRSPLMKPVSVAAVIAVAVLSITISVKLSPPAYALEQTYKALLGLRFLHIVQHDPAGQVTDERWIEIGDKGYQVRYRQDNPAPRNFGVIQDSTSTAVYYHDKKGVVVYDSNDEQYHWVTEPGKVFENLLQEGKILQENTRYKGRRAHKVWWPFLTAECYIDPETKLPMAFGDTEFSYEEPPAGTFEIVIPEGYTAIDRRPGAASEPTPDWLLEEENAAKKRTECVNRGAHALVRGDYAEAAVQLEQALGNNSWVAFWLGHAYCGFGKYDLAIEHYDKLYKAFGGSAAEPVPYCNYARGVAFARSGRLEAARKDFQACLPAMIRTLRTPSGGIMFELGDNPLIQLGAYQPGEREIVVNMINRLRLITGQDFGYDPNATDAQNEAAISAWEQWLKSSGQVKFTPDAKPLPAAAKWVDSMGWGRKSNQEIAARYNEGWLYQITAPTTLLKVGFALYDAKRYDEALTVFKKMRGAAHGNEHVEATALIWQGHMLDLLSRRNEAVAIYQQVAEMGLTSGIIHAQYRMDYSFSSYARERIDTPFTRIENLDEN